MTAAGPAALLDEQRSQPRAAGRAITQGAERGQPAAPAQLPRDARAGNEGSDEKRRNYLQDRCAAHPGPPQATDRTHATPARLRRMWQHGHLETLLLCQLSPRPRKSKRWARRGRTLSGFTRRPRCPPPQAFLWCGPSTLMTETGGCASCPPSSARGARSPELLAWWVRERNALASVPLCLGCPCGEFETCPTGRPLGAAAEARDDVE